MKKKILAVVLCGVFSAVSPVYASDDIESMSYKELLQAYRDLEEKYNKLAGIEVQETAEETPVDDSIGSFEADLSAGFYTPGVDIPFGTYTITAVSGMGNIHSSDAGLNEIMENPKSEYSIDTFNGAKLTTSSVLSVGNNLIIHIKSDDAQVNNMDTRIIGQEVQTDLGAGNYTAGTDFPVGTYNVVALDGFGNVHSSEADLNEILSVSGDFGISQVNNVKFESGAALEVSGCTLRLVPVGE